MSDGDSKRTKQVKGITQASLKIGAGAVLYLQTLKTLAILFFILMLINLPIYIMYASSTNNNAYTDTEEGLRFFTIGNLGQMNPSCGSLTVDFADSDQVLDLRCPIEGQYMTNIKSYGFLQYADPKTKLPASGPARCSIIENDRWEKRRRLVEEAAINNALNSTTYNLDNNCDIQNDDFFKTEDSKEAIKTLFESECVEKESCQLQGLSQYFSKTCQDRTKVSDIGGVTVTQMSSEFIFVVGCIGNTVKFAGANLNKAFILVLAVIIDFLSLLIMLHFFTKLEKFNGEYIKIYNENNLTMRDFAI